MCPVCSEGRLTVASRRRSLPSRCSGTEKRPRTLSRLLKMVAPLQRRARMNALKRAAAVFGAVFCVFSYAASIAPAASEHGMVVTAQHIASQVGVDVLKKGGNSVDAAVAVGYALAVVYPAAGN